MVKVIDYFNTEDGALIECSCGERQHIFYGSSKECSCGKEHIIKVKIVELKKRGGV